MMQYGALIVDPRNRTILSVGYNHASQNPLWHGEVHTLKKFYELPKEKRPDEKNCLFISSHEPCSLCKIERIPYIGSIILISFLIY